MKDHVVGAEKLTDGGNVGRMTAYVHHGVFRAVKRCQDLFERSMRRTFAGNKARGRGAGPPALQSIRRCLRDFRMPHQIQIVIRREIQKRFAVDRGMSFGNAVVALKKGIENARALRHIFLNAQLFVGRKICKSRKARINGRPRSFFGRPTARNGSGSRLES